MTGFTDGNDKLLEQIPAKHLENFKLLRQGILEQNAKAPIEDDDKHPAPPCFFYGTLMALPVLFNVIYFNPEPPKHITDHLTVRPAILKGHRRQIVRHCDYPGVIVHEGSEVAGTVVTGLTMRNLRELNRFEGVQYTLAPIKVNVLMERTLKTETGPDGEAVYENEVWKEMDAMTYLYTAGDKRLDSTRDWNFKSYMTTRMSTWSGLITPVSDQKYDSRGYWKDAVVVTKTTTTTTASTDPSLY